MAQVVWTDAALAGVAEIRTTIAEENPGAAAEIATDLIAAGDSLDRFPSRGAPVEGGRRKLIVRRRYVIVYRVDPAGSRATILAVLDGRRVRRPAAP